jgi:recombination protein RecA
MYNEGISKSGDVLDLGTELNLIDKRGAYYRYGETLLGQGRENAKQFLIENPAFQFEIENLVRQEAGLPFQTVEVGAAEETVEA